MEDVVTRRIECQDQMKTKKEKITRQLGLRKDVACRCFISPFILSVLFLLAMILWLLIFTPSGDLSKEIYLNSSALTLTVDYNSLWCKSLNVERSYQVNLFDFYAFSHKNDAESLITTTLNERFVLRGSQNHTFETMILPYDTNMNFSLHFCIHSVDSSSIVRMYELSRSEYESFSEPNDQYYTAFWPKKFRSNSCYDSMILFDHSSEGKVFVVFTYKGEGNVSVEVKSLRSTRFDTSKASSHCKNTRYCTIPGLPLTKFVVITNAFPHPARFSGDLSSNFEVTCSFGILPCAIVVGSLVLILFAWFLLYMRCMKKKCFPWITKNVLQKHQAIQGYEWYVENTEVKYRRTSNEQVWPTSWQLQGRYPIYLVEPDV